MSMTWNGTGWEYDPIMANKAKDLTLQTTASGDTSRGPTQQGATHTPGPWTYEDKFPCCIWADGVWVASTNVDSVRDFEVRAANARLIAQSPALLAALKALVDETERCDRPGDYGVGSSADVMEKARAVILAAEGSDRP